MRDSLVTITVASPGRPSYSLLVALRVVEGIVVPTQVLQVLSARALPLREGENSLHRLPRPCRSLEAPRTPLPVPPHRRLPSQHGGYYAYVQVSYSEENAGGGGRKEEEGLVRCLLPRSFTPSKSARVRRGRTLRCWNPERWVRTGTFACSLRCRPLGVDAERGREQFAACVSRRKCVGEIPSRWEGWLQKRDHS